MRNVYVYSHTCICICREVSCLSPLVLSLTFHARMWNLHIFIYLSEILLMHPSIRFCSFPIWKIKGRLAEITSTELPDIETSFYTEEEGGRGSERHKANNNQTLLPLRTYDQIVPEKTLKSLHELHESLIETLTRGEEVSEGNTHCPLVCLCLIMIAIYYLWNMGAE